MRSAAARGPLACFAALGIFWGAWAALIPDIKRQAGASDGELGVAMLVSGIGAILAMLIVGRLWRRFGWQLLPVTGLFFAAAALGLPLAGSTLTLAGALFLIGAGSGSLDVVMNAAVSDVEARDGARLMYGAHALFSLAVLVASICTGLARQAGTGPWPIIGTVTVLIALVALTTIASARGSRRLTEPAPTAGRGSGSNGPAMVLGGLTALAVLCAVGYLIEDAAQNWSALHLERGLGASPALGGAAPGIFAAAMLVGRSSGQRLGARFSDRAMLTAGAALAAVGLAVLSAAPTPVLALAGLAGAGAGIAAVAPALYGRAGRDATAGNRGAAIARLTVFGYTGFIIGPALIGFISQAASLPVALATLAGLAVGWPSAASSCCVAHRDPTSAPTRSCSTPAAPETQRRANGTGSGRARRESTGPAGVRCLS
jgi:MFS family permease